MYLSRWSNSYFWSTLWSLICRKIIAGSSSKESALAKMNLNEYMVTLEKPLGIRFALRRRESVRPRGPERE
ncbi:hypothetical protein OROMI_011556 [Orobanche minor]